MEINHFFVEKERVDGMKLEGSKTKVNLFVKEIKESINERIMVIGNLIQSSQDIKPNQKHALLLL